MLGVRCAAGEEAFRVQGLGLKCYLMRLSRIRIVEPLC